jgi:hypothetical protein
MNKPENLERLFKGALDERIKYQEYINSEISNRVELITPRFGSNPVTLNYVVLPALCGPMGRIIPDSYER